MRTFIRRYIWDGRLAGWRFQPIFMLLGRILCLVGKHGWVIVSSSDGKYQTCGVCGAVIKNEREKE